jgi:urease accessory protein
MQISPSAKVALFVLAATVAPAAWAHPGHGGVGFAAGFTHPFTGVDHLLALLAIGIWAARQQGAARLGVAALVLVSMAAGALTAFSGFALPAIEPTIAASLVILGLAVAGGARQPGATGFAIVALFAIVHGYAHGAEAAAATMGAYLAGMLLASAVLQGVGQWLGSVLRAPALRWAGTGVAAAGALIWVVGA